MTKNPPPPAVDFASVKESVPPGYVLFKRRDKRFVLKRHSDGAVIYSTPRLDRAFSRILKLPDPEVRNSSDRWNSFETRWSSFENRNNRRIERARQKSQRMRMC